MTRGRTPTGFTTRTALAHLLVQCSHSRQTGSPGSRQVVSEHDEVSDRAGSRYTSPKRCTRCCLRHDLTASAPRTKVISRLNTQPARAPVNASPAPLPSPTHDSGSLWIATPSTCDSFLHYNSPVSRRTDAVGTGITPRPPHRSVRAELPHTAPPLGSYGRDVAISTCRSHAVRSIRVTQY